jgi:two-component system nitrogen regulation response regulator GlnG
MCKQIGRLAAQDANVLILGESGTGKELVARAIYSHSKRIEKPFSVINCAAIPENLVESELFGHERGAFTGADRQRVGRFEQCGDGTVLLDEIGDMPISAQAKMLRLLQEQQFERVGGNRPITTRVRILAATNQNLEKLISEGKFRSDLYYRLKVATIQVPPLRERREDIPELAFHFLFRYARESDRDIRGISPEAIDLLQRYDWPGNVRQLQNCIQAAVCQMAGRTILPADVAAHLTSNLNAPVPASNPVASDLVPTFDLAATIEAMIRDGGKDVYARIVAAVERELFTRALHFTHGRQAQASDLLGINRATLRYKLREMGLSLDKVVSERMETHED